METTQTLAGHGTLCENPARLSEPYRCVAHGCERFLCSGKIPKPLGSLAGRVKRGQHAPAALPRRLVAEGSRVFVTLGYGAPVTALDAATGSVLNTYPATADAQEIILADEKLYVVIGEQPVCASRMRAPELPEWLAPYPQYVHLFPPKHIVCVDVDSAKVLWTRQGQETKYLLPLTMATDRKRLYFQNEKSSLPCNGMIYTPPRSRESRGCGSSMPATENDSPHTNCRPRQSSTRW